MIILFHFVLLIFYIYFLLLLMFHILFSLVLFLLKSKLSAKARDYARQISISNERMVRLVDDLLNVACVPVVEALIVIGFSDVPVQVSVLTMVWVVEDGSVTVWPASMDFSGVKKPLFSQVSYMRFSVSAGLYGFAKGSFMSSGFIAQ
jgi:hypothetical protein